MQLLGPYDSKLSSFIYQELVAMLESAISAGDYGAGKLFSRQSLEALRLQGTEFSQLPLASAGQRAYAETLNSPIRLLAARYAAIVSETGDFVQTLDRLLSTLEKDTQLAERLLRLAALDPWVSQQPTLVLGSKFAMDLAANAGPVALTVPNTDPLSGISNSNKVQEVCFSYKGDPLRSTQTIQAAMTGQLAVKTITPVTLQWHYGDSGAEVESVLGDDWTKLSFVHPNPVIDFGQPAISTISPENESAASVYRIEGVQNTDNLPVFVRTLFVPRKRKITVTAGEEIILSQYRIDRNNLYVHAADDTAFYEENVDYTVDDLNRILPLSSIQGEEIAVLFTEYYPGYQCSVNEVNWSPVILFDPDNPYPNTDRFFPLSIDGNRFPVLDETATPTGLTITMANLPRFEYLFKIQPAVVTRTSTQSATLEIEFERLRMLNGLRLNSVSNFPLRIRRIYEAVSYGGQITRPIFTSAGPEDDLILTTEITVRFPRQELQRLFVEFHQENYTYKEHILDTAAGARRELLESVLPSPSPAGDDIRRLYGVQYEMSLEHIAGQDIDFETPTVITFGPYAFSGCPEVLKLNTNHLGTVEYYFIDRPYDANGNRMTSVYELLDPDNTRGVALTDDLPHVYLRPAAAVSRVEFYLKVIFRQAESLLEKFVFQAV